MRAKYVTVYGSVQGVGFRYYTLQCARTHGICGWVRNTEDGTVEIHGEGDDDSVRVFLRAVETGAPFSKVRNINVQSADFHAYKDFRIQY